ncbi:linear gramicidin synthetase LgrC [Kutzneria sp. 744]|nr:linear gramicidin synthetase LgrC [Kutzneria sp. 744]
MRDSTSEEGTGVERIAHDSKAIALHRRINDTAVSYPDETGVGELFERRVAESPTSVAVIHRDRSVSYDELNRLANGVAARLSAAGVRPGAVVGVAIGRTPELVAALLGILKCGACYLPFDIDWPDARLRDLVAQTDCATVLTDNAEALAARLPELAVLPVDDTVVEENPRTAVDPDAIAYINFTSGSTGQPKGVPIRHRSIARLVFGARYARLDEHSRLLQLAPVTFDAATFELWGALLHGGACVLYPSRFPRFSELGRVIDTHGITVLFLTTALFNSIVDEAPEILDGVGTVLTGGEAHSLKHIDAALRRYGPDRIVSMYGPTECTTFALYHPVRERRMGETALPIGLPIQNTRAYLVGEHGLCGPGETGEILLAGPGLSPGYLGLPAGSGQFVDREIDGAVERLYRTGDRAYLRDDGVFVFQGRLDDQVKVNGYRVELGEISHHLDQHPAVRQNFVTVRETAGGDKALVAFVVSGEQPGTAEQIRDHLRARLPAFMVPAEIRFRDTLPLSATGKVDRRALLAELAERS